MQQRVTGEPESERLAAAGEARRLLEGTSRWPDVLTRMVAGALGVRCAVVSVLDGPQQIVVGEHGLGGTIGRDRVGPVRSALCSLVLRDGVPVVIDDVHTDKRAAGIMFDGGFPLAAYAGFPVRDGDEHLVGVVCAVHDRPTPWTAAQLAMLDDARQVVAAAVSGAAAGMQLAGYREADRQRAFLDALLDSLHAGVAAVDNEGRMVLYNRALRETTGIDAASSDPMRWPARAHVFHPDGRQAEVHETPLARALGGETVRDAEQMLKQPGRPPRLYAVNAQPIIGADGQTLGAMSTVYEITERRRAEAFRRCESACSHALAQADNATVAGQAVLEAVATTLGWPYAELWLTEPGADGLCPAATWTAPGRDITVALPAQLSGGDDLVELTWRAGAPQVVPDLAAAAGTRSRETGAVTHLHAALAIPVRNGPRVTGVLALYADTVQEPQHGLIGLLVGITAQIGEFLERRRAEDLALQLAHTKDEYIALVGHELRTPLTSIASYTELLDGYPDDTPLGAVRDLLAVVTRNNAQLRGTIDDLLDLAALDAGHARLHLQDADVSAVIRDALAAIAPAADVQGVTVHTEVPATCVVHGDPMRLRQVVDNLVHNAVKYSPGGGTVTVTLHPADGMAELLVADTGIGIPAEERARVFSRFFRSSLARNHGIPGTGLGLAISAVIVQRHGGTISLLPPAARGTTVRVCLPVAGR